MAAALYAWAGALGGVSFGLWNSATRLLELVLVFLLDQWSCKHENPTKPGLAVAALEPTAVAALPTPLAPGGLGPAAAAEQPPPAAPAAAVGMEPATAPSEEGPAAALWEAAPAAAERYFGCGAGAAEPACEPAGAAARGEDEPHAPPPAAEASWASEEPAAPAAAPAASCSPGPDGTAAVEALPSPHAQVAPAADFEFRPIPGLGVAAPGSVAC